ncbi:MAG: hypothetical protein ABW252_03025 [Polyangiales bacterium]
MNDSKLITIDDDSLDQVSGGTFGLLGALVAVPFKIVGGLLGGLFGGGYCAPQPPACPPPRPRPPKGC